MPFDETLLAERASALLAHPPQPLATMPYTLRAMQDSTLSLYQELLDDPIHTNHH